MSYSGIDVSTWQGKIDWNSVAKNNITFAMIRATFGQTGVDNQFVNNMENIKNTSIAAGAYHYSYAKSIQDAQAEANHFLKTIRPYSFQYPVAFDIEDSSLVSLGKQVLTSITLTFCETVEKAGYYTCIYSNLNWLSNYLDMSILDKFDVWLAQWNNKPTYEGNFGIWQYSSSGSISGISGDVDMNTSFRDYPSIIKQAGLNQPQGSNTDPIPTEPNSPPDPSDRTYTVVEGDTLWGIAQRFLGDGTKYTEIKTLNRLSSDVIFAGQVLKIPS